MHILQLNTDKSIKATKALLIFLYGYTAYLLSHFVAQKAIYSNIIFYMGVVSPLLYHLYYSREELKILTYENKILAVLFSYILVHSLFVLTPEMQLALALKGTRSVISTFLFILATLIFFHNVDIKSRKTLLTSLCIICGIFALISVLLYLFANYDNRIRLVPLGFIKHEILGASLYATSAIISLYLMFTSANRAVQILHLVIYSIIFIMVLMTISRGPILALAASTGIGILLFYDWKMKNLLKIIIASIISLIVIAIIIFASPEYTAIIKSYLSPFLERGTSYRLTLWQLTLDRISERPVLGYGVKNVFESDVPGGTSPHNLFLSAAYYFGIPVLIMLLAALCQATRNTLKGIQRGNYNSLLLVLLSHAIFSVLTDHGHFVKSNAPIWLIFWLPVCMCLANTNKRVNANLRQGTI